MYPMPTAPNPIAKVVRFRRSHLLVADIILFASLGLVTNPDVEQGEKREIVRAFKGVLDMVGCSTRVDNDCCTDWYEYSVLQHV